MVMACVNLALAELVSKVDSLQVCVPFSLRGFPSTLKKLNVNNDFACVPFWLRFPKDKTSSAGTTRLRLYEKSD